MHPFRKVLSLVPIILITLLSACGGGSGGNSETPAVTWKVTSTAGTGGTVSPVSQSVVEGQSATITITPDSGFGITSVRGCGGVLEGNSYTTGGITADCTVEVSFSEGPQAVIYNIGATGSPVAGGSVSGGGSYGEGTVVTVSATANVGYTFENWSESGSPVSTVADYSFSATAERTLIATFSLNTYSIGGSVNGLSGTLVLQNNSGDYLTLDANGSFTFGGELLHGSSYAVAIDSQPNGQVCSVSDGSGTATADVTGIGVTCLNLYSIGGNVSGLAGSLALQSTGGDDITLAADGSFSFATPLLDGSRFAVTVKTQPTGQHCSVAGGDGTVSADVAVSVQCFTPVSSNGAVWQSISHSGTGDHTVAIKSDGSLWAWGYNYYGQLGDGTTDNKYVPTQIGTDTDWASVSTGRNSTFALKTDGSLWAWGSNSWGVLGMGSTSSISSVPVQVGTATDWASVMTNYNHTVALKSNGTLWAWGSNSYGELGDGTTTSSTSPIQIGTATDWASVAAGDSHTLAVKSDGTLWAWGRNNYGQLGDSTTTDQHVPTMIGADTNWTVVSGGKQFSAALKDDGTLWTWGYYLGAAQGSSSNPTVVPTQIGSDTDWSSLSTNYSYYGLAVKSDGSLWKWGYARSPSLLSSNSVWTSVAIGNNYQVALQADGTLWTWGKNPYGQLGNGSAEEVYAMRVNPVEIDTAGADQVVAGGYSSFSIKADGTRWAWGVNDRYQFGDGTTSNSSSPIQIGTDTDWSQLESSPNGRHFVAIKADGTLWAWGYNDYGQLGSNGVPYLAYDPIQIGTESDWASVAAGDGYTLAIKSGGSLWAWGHNNVGQLGDGTTSDKFVPTRIGTASDWASVSAGDVHALAVKSDGSLWAWGRNSYGQLGDNTTVDKLVPTRIGTKTDWSSVSAGYYLSGAIKQGGTLWMWGWNPFGYLGDGSYTDKHIPTQIGAATDWSILAVGDSFSGAIKTDGTLWMWGENYRGQLGDGTTSSKSTPTQTGTATDWMGLALGSNHTVARTTSSIWAWGDNTFGQLGFGNVPSEEDEPNPYLVAY